MSTHREALTRALPALEDLAMKHYENTGEVLYKDVYTAVKQALAERPDRLQDAAAIGLAVATWTGGMFAHQRSDTGQFENWVTTSVDRLGNAVKDFLSTSLQPKPQTERQEHWVERANELLNVFAENDLPEISGCIAKPKPQPEQPKPLTDEEAHQTLLDMAKYMETFGDDSLTDQQLSAECLRFILERVADHNIGANHENKH